MQGSAHVLADFFTGDFSTMYSTTILIDLVGNAASAKRREAGA
ncbi:MAG TPA: hypothetical protein VK932_06865 [Kofleriaceae bacterium]|nr:hypothetical protein [Kofleriaceae bacterium]